MSLGGSWLRFKMEYSDDDTKRIIQLIRELGDENALTKKVLPEIGAIYKQSVLDNFEKQQDIRGVPWKGLTGTTLKYKRDGMMGRRASRKPEKIGFWLGNLIKSIRTRTFKGKGNMVVVGTNMYYAKTFQFGAKKGAFGSDEEGRPVPWGDIPARPFLTDARNAKLNQSVRLVLYRHFREIWDQRRLYGRGRS